MWPAHGRAPVALLWVWMKPFHVRSRLSPLLVAPDDPPLPCHPDASGAQLSRLPSPAASSHTQGRSEHHSAPQCFRSARLQRRGGWQWVPASCFLLGESATRWDAEPYTGLATRSSSGWVDPGLTFRRENVPLTLLQPGGGHMAAF